MDKINMAEVNMGKAVSTKRKTKEEWEKYREKERLILCLKQSVKKLCT